MAVNISNSELKETQGMSLPRASLESLRSLRDEMCSKTTSKDFKLQNYQRFLRRVLSPDSPVRNLLVMHGTGTGKTCTAIQISEEYITRPEFQDKTVLVLANPAVQENFKNQIFNLSKVTVDSGVVNSKQCTGRRYLDMILRVQNEPMKWTDPQVREKIADISQKLIKEFYEFQGYTEFSNNLTRQSEIGSTHLEAWIHRTFDNRMIIVDEAHNLRMTDEGIETKITSLALKHIIEVAENVTLILLTATPMFDDYIEIMYYFNLFLLNDRKQKKFLDENKVFDEKGNFKSGMEKEFQSWCQDYVSYVRGDNPLTFPFRLSPSKDMIAPKATIDWETKQLIPENEQRSFLDLTGSYVKGIQKDVLTNPDLIKSGPSALEQVLCVFPDNQPFAKMFTLSTELDSTYKYTRNTEKFLSPSKIDQYSSKFSLVTKMIPQSKGIIFVYSNLVKYGADLFAMCLEEHGYSSALGNQLLEKTAGEFERGSKGKYALFTSNIAEGDRRRLIDRLKSPSNADGSDIKIIVGSKAIAEGIDLSNVRQIHILDFWWNMARIEQAVGRGIRTCSHSKLPFEEQNCTVYLHVCKHAKEELTDEYYYRKFVEIKARSISRIKNIIMEYAMDCKLQTELNTLPEEWNELTINQTRSYKNESVKIKLGSASSPIFGDISGKCKTTEKPEDPDHERPLSSYLDVRDEILDKLITMFTRKPVWTLKDLEKSVELKSYTSEVLIYTLQSAIESGFQLKDANGRLGKLESKGDMYAFTTDTFNSLQDRLVKRDETKHIPLRLQEVSEKVSVSLDQAFSKMKWLGDIKTRFPKEILEWYVLDHILHPRDRLEHMVSLDWSKPPVYAKRLKTKHFRILGSKQIYEGREKIVPIGDQLDEYQRWVDDLKERFLSQQKNIFATMESKTLKFNIDEKEVEIQKAKRSKVIGGRSCGVYLVSILDAFAIWLGTPFPDYIKTRSTRCTFLALLVRSAALEGKIDWWTPEEWSILQEDENRKELLLKLKE